MPGELLPAGEGLYYSRSYHKDTARSEERTIVATTSDPRTRASTTTGARPSEMKPMLEERMRGASAGKTMYVDPLPDGASRARRWRRTPPASSSPTPAPSCCT